MANFPFATIEPNVGIVPVPDRRLDFLAETIASQNSKSQTSNFKQILNSDGEIIKRDNWPPIVPATVKFTDIAGIIKGASQGEGLGNKFLSHIREVDAIVHVVRAFADSNVVKQGVTNPKSDFEVVKTELELADLEMREKHEKKKGKDSEVLPMLVDKPYLVAINVDEDQLVRSEELEKKYAEELGVNRDQVVIVSAKTEMELAELSDEEQLEYLQGLGVTKSGLERLVKKAFTTLGLMTYLTAGEKEVRAWTVKRGTPAPEAAGVIHSDFVKHFISARVCQFEDFVEHAGWKGAAEKGRVRQEGRDYVVREGDVIEFLIGS